MAHLPAEKLLTFLGTVIYGDIGPLTIYRNKRGKLVAFQKTFPKHVPTPFQVTQRQLFIDAAQAWRALSPTQKAEWETATQRGSLPMTGYNLFVHWQLEHDDEAIQAVQRQTNTHLIPTEP